MQPADLRHVVTVSDPSVAPSGDTVAVVVGTVDLEANRTRSAVWLVPTDGGVPAPGSDGIDGTDGTELDGQPAFSPTGDRLVFARTVRTDGDGETSILVVAVDGLDVSTQPLVVATTSEQVQSLRWSPDGTRLAWCARVPEIDPAMPDRDRPPRRISTLQTRLDDVGWTVDRRQQVHVAPADGSGPVRIVTSGPYDHESVDWSPDGASLVVVGGRHDGWDLDEATDLWIVDPAGCTPPDGDAHPRRLTDGTRRWHHPSWSPDGSRIAGMAQVVSNGWRNAKPFVVDVATGAITDLAPTIDRSFVPTMGDRPPVWEGERTLLTSHEDGGRVHVVRVAADGSRRPELVVGGDRWVAGFDTAAGVLAALVTTPTQPVELEVNGHRTSFTRDFVAAVPPFATVRFAVPSPAGDGDLDAWLIAPAGFDPAADSSAKPSESGRRWPLLLSVHGGPMSQYGDRWFDEFQLLAGAGFVVVAANPHGSSGRDDAFQRAIRSPKAAIEPGSGWGGVDADDLVAVVDAALARWPSLDPARVGVLGGSYGGFMASWLLARTDRFAAGCSERSVNNLLSEEWSSDLAGTFHPKLGVSHLDDPDEYIRMSPVTYARDLSAPVLILHSEQDLRCHPEQADALFVALRLLGHPDVEYWRFPGEGHELSRAGSPRHRVQRAELINAFFTRTLGAGPQPPPT